MTNKLGIVIINSKNIDNATPRRGYVNSVMKCESRIELNFPYNHSLMIYSDKFTKNALTITPPKKNISKVMYFLLYNKYISQYVDMDTELLRHIWVYMKYIT